jgi:ATP-dependent DNA helicase RecQ
VKPLTILKKYWGHGAFRGSQEAIIENVLEKHDVLALLPTGGGKSVCYQVPALCNEGICIVVSPLIALIHDQVASLKKKGIKAVSLAGGMPSDEVISLLDNCQYGGYKFLYLSPERLGQEMVQERISQLDINLIAIDEAHCISQWGNDFRPAYLECSVLRGLHPEVPVIALTATATREVSADIIGNLALQAPRVFKDSFLRENIAYSVILEEDKRYRLKKLCTAEKQSGIIYVRSRKMAENLAGFLLRCNTTATYYHGGVSTNEKKRKLNDWLNSKVQFMVATNAFGMGVDKPDVRLVVHYQLPESLEHYFQEAGRAGRDGAPAQALLLTNPADEIALKRQFLGSLPDITFLKDLYKKLNNYFQIPYGTGENTTHTFSFLSFCDAYDFPTSMAYNGLLLLDRHSVISLSQNFRTKTRVQFVASKGTLWNYLETNKDLAPVVQLILRTYGGIFDYETKINTLLIGKKAAVDEAFVFRLLERLKKDGIILYEAQQGDLEISFLVPREDDRTINTFSHLVREQQRLKEQHLENILAYVHNRKLCRSRQLLSYFGEKSAIDCGSCDVCLSKRKISGPGLKTIEQEIISVLGTRPMSSRKLIQMVGSEEAAVLGSLQLLLEAGQIKINTKNEYSLI